MNNIFRNVVILFLVVFFSFIFSEFVGESYDKIFGQSGSFVDLRSLSGLPLAFIFFLTLLFTAFGGSKKYWWIGILLLPAAAFEVYFDWSHIYFPIAIGLIGWLLGLGISRLLSRSQDV